MTVHYQSMVRKQANMPIPVLQNLEDMGWTLYNGELKPAFMTTDAVPVTCTNISFENAKNYAKHNSAVVGTTAICALQVVVVATGLVPFSNR